MVLQKLFVGHLLKPLKGYKINKTGDSEQTR